MTPSITVERAGARAAEKPSTTASGAPHSAAFWFAGWLFTIGFCKLVWWKALLGLVVWPYFLGALLAK